MTKIIMIVIACYALGFTGMVSAAELLARDASLLKQQGISIHPELKFINGTLHGVTGVRFGSTNKVETFRDWYQKKLPNWAVNNQYGTWVLYDGKPGGGPSNYMTKKQIMIIENKNLPQWFSLPAAMTTEVIIVVPNE